VDVVNVCLGSGALDTADAASKKLLEISTPVNRMTNYRLRVAVLSAKKDTSGLYEMYTKMLADYPDSFVARSGYAYYGSLLGSGQSWVKLAYDYVQQAPSVLSCRITLALALYKNGDATRAYEILSAARVKDWSLMPVGWQCLYTAVCQARELPAPTIVPHVLKTALPEERAMVKIEVQAPAKPAEKSATPSYTVGAPMSAAGR
jgi:hypothetical protein